MPEGSPPELGPHPQMEVGGTEDTFVVYQGHVDRPLDQPAVWRCTSPTALRSPDVPAVDQFREAIYEAEKLQKSNPPSKH
ncbi:MAG TPA: hypothetical protein VMF66_15500 [Candidatus Acidoferrum sp.]|nr:hypothetical protein [Candidatus Acidoferrum sp.]